MSTLTTLLRRAALATGPLAVAALVLLFAALAVVGGSDAAALAKSPLAVASSVAALLAVCGLLATALSIAIARTERPLAPVAAAFGSVLAAGGMWALVFVMPGLADTAPKTLSHAMPSVVTGYVVSFLVFGIGWIATGIGLLRSRAVSRGAGIALVIGAVLAIVPAPDAIRLLVVSVAATFVVRRLASRTTAVTG